ncbi:copper/silver resistance outer membrane protein [Psychromonas sp. CNPT3]|uniref:TolC family protein n=1 Tax=Psychromonas sp. CNPT3 TaxID=314282 RepID=UPI00006E9163|nr:TolC family protein [Psychromonas sp. CNPT3]AGH81839.1 copper/silver resistance outer membrane protein [Psychromonas sp. CNPT3]
MKHILVVVCLLFSVSAWTKPVNLAEALDIALQTDPANKLYQHQRLSLIAQGKNSASLSSPMLKLGIANLDTDTFSIDKDPMSQLTLGLSQQFSRGDSLKLRQEGFNLASESSVFSAQERRLQVKKVVRSLWFNILFIEKSKQIVAQKKVYLNSFYRDLQSQYSLGLLASEDVIESEIKIAQQDEKLASLTQISLNYRTLLSEWIGVKAFAKLDNSLPIWEDTLAYTKGAKMQEDAHYALLAQHPKIKILNQNVTLASNKIALAKQGYKPTFKVELGYGHRLSSMDNGRRRSDLLSAFVTLDMPFFSTQKQDQQVISAQQLQGAKQAEYYLLLRQLNASMNNAISRYQHLVKRQWHYKNTLLKQSKRRTHILEKSYQSNTRPFKDVIKAYINELDLSLQYQKLYFDGLQSLINIRYFQAI